ncbi:hypothetical protein ACPFP2_20645 [Micromonospora citrea]|uniref:hypothetical protein n=1 Tax=Micromonospora citrea TaxID=47855 RepID=UPI003C62503B
MRSTLIRAAAASALGVALILGGIPGIASAATTACAYHGYDRACATNSTSYSLEVCDNEDDGHVVDGWAEGIDGIHYGYSDSYGGGCRTRSVPVKIRSVWVCELQGAGCSSRVYL